MLLQPRKLIRRATKEQLKEGMTKLYIELCHMLGQMMPCAFCWRTVVVRLLRLNPARRLSASAVVEQAFLKASATRPQHQKAPIALKLP